MLMTIRERGGLALPCQGERAGAFYNPPIENPQLFKPCCCFGEFCSSLVAAFLPPLYPHPPRFLSHFFWAPRGSPLFAHEKFHTSLRSEGRSLAPFPAFSQPQNHPAGGNFPKPTASTRENLSGGDFAHR